MWSLPTSWAKLEMQNLGCLTPLHLNQVSCDSVICLHSGDLRIAVLEGLDIVVLASRLEKLSNSKLRRQRLASLLTLGTVPFPGTYSTKSGEGNGNPLQYSCLETPRDGGAWWAAVCGAARSWTRLKRLSSSSSSSSSSSRASFTRSCIYAFSDSFPI